ncbi:MAG: family transcriptional regulator, dissimilatory nitrate respiration regulator [Candidatus Hydrogenedentes bacterium]|nr:family transcriptional regulator, dissimilatory nitrate respiration regulator [Candidatus Hydrogenedentota bacterium]
MSDMQPDQPRISDRIAEIPLFSGLPEPYLHDLAAIATRRIYDRGQSIFSEGDAARGFYVLTKGRAKVFKLAPEGKEQILHMFGPGEPIGEVPMFQGESYPANAAALEPSQALFFPRTDIIALMRKEPDLALKMLAMLSKRLRRFTELIDDLSLKEVPGRLARYLLGLRKRPSDAEVEMPVSKAQLASLLGTIPETLSRIIARMTKEGLIASASHQHIRLLDPEALEQLAQGENRLT